MLRLLPQLRTTAFRSVLVLGFIFGSTNLAFAQANEKDREHARELMAQGREARDKSDYPTALKSFQAAHDLMHVTTTAYELAKTQQLANLFVEAHETIVMLRAIPGTPSDPEPFKEARAKADALDKEILEKTPSLKITVATTDPKVVPTVTVDNQPATTDAPRKVNPGKHVVVARGGGAEAQAEVNVNLGETKPVDLKLETKAMVVDTTKPEKGPVPVVSYIGFGVAAAGVVVGTITGVMAFGEKDDIEAKCPNKKCTEQYREDLDGAQDVATISTVSFVVAGVGAAVGVIGLFFLRHQEKEQTVGGSSSSFGWKNVNFAGNGLRGTF